MKKINFTKEQENYVKSVFKEVKKSRVLKVAKSQYTYEEVIRIIEGLEELIFECVDMA